MSDLDNGDGGGRSCVGLYGGKKKPNLNSNLYIKLFWAVPVWDYMGGKKKPTFTLNSFDHNLGMSDCEN